MARARAHAGFEQESRLEHLLDLGFLPRHRLPLGSRTSFWGSGGKRPPKLTKRLLVDSPYHNTTRSVEPRISCAKRHATRVRESAMRESPGFAYEEGPASQAEPSNVASELHWSCRLLQPFVASELQASRKLPVSRKPHETLEGAFLVNGGLEASRAPTSPHLSEFSGAAASSARKHLSTVLSRGTP